MKIFCPHCNQSYEIEPDHLGIEVECLSCKKVFTVSYPGQKNTSTLEASPAQAPVSGNLIYCRDCGRQISKNAQACPGCGAPAKLPEPEFKSIVTDAEAARLTSKPGKMKKSAEGSSKTTGIVLSLIGVLGALSAVSMYFEAAKAAKINIQTQAIIIGIISVIILLIGNFLLERARRWIICPNPNCGFRGYGKSSGGASGCIFLLLLMLGIIPGLIYLMWPRNGVICPHCGNRVR